MAGSTVRCRSKLLAGAAAGTDGIRQLAVSIHVFIRRQQFTDQPGEPDRRRIVASERLPGPTTPRKRRRLRCGYPVEMPAARNRLEQLQLWGALGPAASL